MKKQISIYDNVPEELENTIRAILDTAYDSVLSCCNVELTAKQLLNDNENTNYLQVIQDTLWFDKCKIVELLAESELSKRQILSKRGGARHNITKQALLELEQSGQIKLHNDSYSITV